MTGKRKNEGGFTLLEVLIALTILAVGLLGIAAMQTTAILANKSSHEFSQGTFLCEQILEQAKAQAFDAIQTSPVGISAGNPNTAAFDNTVPTALVNGVTYFQVWNVFQPNADLKEITAYVLWRDRIGSWHQIAMKTSRSSL